MTIADDIKDDVKDADAPEGGLPSGVGDEPAERALAVGQGSSTTTETSPSPEGSSDDDDEEGLETPAQLGGQRFVYAAYFTGAVAVAFLLSKGISFGWSRLALWKPQVGEPDEMVAVVAAAIIGALVAFYYYRDKKTRTLAEEVASQLGQVSWPTRDEVVSGTFVVIVTTVAATAFFALMDRFWGFVTNLVYGA